MISPSHLNSGDTIGIVACGKKVSKRDIMAAVSTFESWGLRVVMAPHVVSDEHSYLAASDDNRKADFQKMINDPAIKAIVCARGGYGSTRIIDDLDFSPMLYKPKWIVGFSDVTAIHLKLVSLGIQSIHGPMPINFSNPAANESINRLKQILFAEPGPIEARASSYNISGKAEGVCVGGNLSLITESLGTGSETDFTECILIIEEIDEYYYRLDRMFNQLKRAGKLENLAGLVIGQMTSMKEEDPAFGEGVEKIVLDKIKGFDYPIGFNFPIGHEQPNLAWISGGKMKLFVSQAGSVLQPGS